MRARRNESCPCGSGLRFKRCCGADPARRAALIEVQDAAAFLPALRPAGAAVLRYCSGVADDAPFNVGQVCTSGPCQGVQECSGLTEIRCSATSSFSGFASNCGSTLV